MEKEKVNKALSALLRSVVTALISFVTAIFTTSCVNL